jgi:hypothetical protein
MLLLGRKAEESQRVFCCLRRTPTTTGPRPNGAQHASDRDEGKSKNANGIRKPESELGPSRTSKSAICVVSLESGVMSWWPCGSLSRAGRFV